MMNAFVARFALDLVGPSGALFDLTGCMWRADLEQHDTIGQHCRSVSSSNGKGLRHPTAPEAAASVLSAFEQCEQDAMPLAVFCPFTLVRRGIFAERLIAALARWDLTHVIDLTACYIPGHGMPTVMLVGRAQPPAGACVFVSRILRGEPSRPDDPVNGVVWQATLRAVEQGVSDEWVRCALVPRERLAVGPWSLEELVP